jgi:hypothetical protein
MSILLSSIVSSSTFGTAVALTGAGTAVGFTGIPSGVRRVQMIFQGVSLSGTDDIYIRIGSGSYATTGYSSYTISLTGAATSIGGTTSTVAFDMPSGSAATSLYGVANFVNIYGNTWVASINVGGYFTSQFAYLINGAIALSGALDRIQISSSGTNTFDQGSVNISYQ